MTLRAFWLHSIFCAFLLFFGFFSPSLLQAGENGPSMVGLKSIADREEVERLIRQISSMPPLRRIEFVSRYLLGRKYHAETKERIKKQRQPKKVEKLEATNQQPLPVNYLQTSLQFLDCMTYVEHVLALSACVQPQYQSEFLCRLIDVMFNAEGKPLMNHLRSHFTSQWGDINERKGYLINIARNHPQAVRRELLLNRVGENRTFYVEDRFLIARQPQQVWYFPVQAVLNRSVKLESGDIVALATDKEGLDVTHMGFFIEKKGGRWLRHASYKLNKVVDQDFDQYLRDGRQIKGLMVFRPVLNAAIPQPYRFELCPTK